MDNDDMISRLFMQMLAVDSFEIGDVGRDGA
jgi:hypothetical protein